MKRIAAVFGCYALMLLCIGSARAEDVGPAKYFDMQEIRDETTLNPVVSSDRVVASTARPGKRVRIIELNFTSQNWKDLVWKHPARIYVPADYQGGGNAGIIGTERQFFDLPDWKRRTIPVTNQNTEAEYAEGTAIDLGMPIMLFANPAQDYWGMSESDFVGYAFKKTLETRDLTWNGYYPITKSYLRAITLLHSLPGIGTERAVLMGCSKRGYGVTIATGVDPDRVAGIMSTCFYGGNTLYFVAKKFAEFGPGVGGPAEAREGPGYQPAEDVLRAINNPVGLQMLTHFDPYFWRNKIRSNYLVTLGTNDEFFALGSPNSMLRDMSGDKAFLAVDNTTHTWVSAKHLAAWRMWLAHTFLGRELPSIQAHGVVEGGKLMVTARVKSPASPLGVRLFYSYNPTSVDWRGAKWDSIVLTKEQDAYTARLPLKEGHKLAYYVEVEDEGKGGPGYVSSLIESVN
ncbi:PhoPQ-activated protein PqaA family protein [Pseudomonas sp. NPDC089530]|uniref:PhoPQ-activated protein PqaA family protein n=1 Tax=Pseudomonas sp. NPDC089530 TaxID=3390651 RepID=UPI003CFFD29F